MIVSTWKLKKNLALSPSCLSIIRQFLYFYVTWQVSNLAKLHLSRSLHTLIFSVKTLQISNSPCCIVMVNKSTPDLSAHSRLSFNFCLILVWMVMSWVQMPRPVYIIFSHQIASNLKSRHWLLKFEVGNLVNHPMTRCVSGENRTNSRYRPFVLLL